MEIANPIYDVVFKYLMEDNKVAKLFLSAVTNLDIVELDFMPQELSSFKNEKKDKKIETALSFSIYRLDFSAKVKNGDGTYVVIIIEVQKSKFTHESMRFRKYLGKQYMNENYFQWAISSTKTEYKTGIPILPIYFLGEANIDFKDHPIIKINKVIKDRYTGEILNTRDKFIDSLFHEGIIINIPSLRKKRRDELEILLSIFDQDNITTSLHIMNVKETDFSEKYQPIIRRLQQAVQEKEVRDTMIVEDDFLAEINDYENRIAKSQQNEHEATRKQEEAVRKQEEAIRKQEEAIRKQEKAILLMLDFGISIEEISKKLKMSEDEIREIEKHYRK